MQRPQRPSECVLMWYRMIFHKLCCLKRPLNFYQYLSISLLLSSWIARVRKNEPERAWSKNDTSTVQSENDIVWRTSRWKFIGIRSSAKNKQACHPTRAARHLIGTWLKRVSCVRFKEVESIVKWMFMGLGGMTKTKRRKKRFWTEKFCSGFDS